MDRALASRYLAAVLLLCAGGCATDFDQRLEEAERLRLDAAARGYEWIGTEGLLEQARERAASGDTEAALALVQEARFQAEAALRQAESESEAWKRRVVK